jgi:hypothetical protein
MKWTTKIPSVEGWYWVSYKGKRGIVVCPALFLQIDDGYSVSTARNDWFCHHNKRRFGKCYFGERINAPTKPTKF